MVTFADNTKKKNQIDQAMIRGIERQKRAIKLNCLDKFTCPVLEAAAAAAAATDGEIIEFAEEGIAALKAGRPIGAYVALELIITELQMRKQ